MSADPLKDLCVGFRGIYWHKWNIIFIITFSFHLQLRTIVFSLRMSPSYLHGECVLFHRACYVVLLCFYSSPEWTTSGEVFSRFYVEVTAWIWLEDGKDEKRGISGCWWLLMLANHFVLWEVWEPKFWQMEDHAHYWAQEKAKEHESLSSKKRKKWRSKMKLGQVTAKNKDKHWCGFPKWKSLMRDQCWEWKCKVA